jgi:hypothetical protein
MYYFKLCADLMSATAPVRVGSVGREDENVQGCQIKNYSFLTKVGNLEYSNFHVDQLLLNNIFKNIFLFNFRVCLPARPLSCNRFPAPASVRLNHTKYIFEQLLGLPTCPPAIVQPFPSASERQIKS